MLPLTGFFLRVVPEDITAPALTLADHDLFTRRFSAATR